MARARATGLLEAATVLVVLTLGLVATAPRAEREAWSVAVVAAPPTPCADAGATRTACLAVARTVAMSR